MNQRGPPTDGRPLTVPKLVKSHKQPKNIEKFNPTILKITGANGRGGGTRKKKGTKEKALPGPCL